VLKGYSWIFRALFLGVVMWRDIHEHFWVFAIAGLSLELSVMLLRRDILAELRR
jgi:hypothetical protein